MTQVFLVRHAQASLGADNYDQLSAHGHLQAQALGEHWRALGLSFDYVVYGTLLRHRQTLQGILQGLGLNEQDLPSHTRAGLNEYDSEAVIATAHFGELIRPTTPEGYKAHFRTLRAGLKLWMQAAAQPVGMPSYITFAQGVMQALNECRDLSAQRVLVISSGGPISTAIGEVLQLSHDDRIEMNLRLRNTAVNELLLTPKRMSIVSWNNLAHLEKPQYKDWVTYA
jgi:broad specificity phosphatase PhoE